MRALVTGASGFVGQYLLAHLLECGDEVLAADLRLRGDTPAGVEARELDVSSFDACSRLISVYSPEVIYHLAGIAFVPEAEDDFNRTLAVNVAGTNNILRSCHLLQLGATVVYISSAEVYGRIAAEDLPLHEDLPLNPANNYSLSKAMGEMVCRRYAQFGQVRVVTMRPFNHIGPGQDPRFVVANFADQLAHIAKRRATPVLRVGNVEAQRDFSDVRDIVRGYRLAALKGDGIYNLCAGRPAAIRLILETLIEIAAVEVRLERDPARMRGAEVPVLYGSYEKARRELGWEPQYELRATLEGIYRQAYDRAG